MENRGDLLMIHPFDSTKEIAIVDDPVAFALDYFLKVGQQSILKRGQFSVALSGGSTPKALYNKLKQCKDALDWNKVFVFFSDERSVPQTDSESNYKSAMDAGFSSLPIPPSHIFRMKAEEHIEENALIYAQLIKKYVPDQSFDLILLGMGDDGHTASLFPNTLALKEEIHLVVHNFVPQKNTMRMTFTFPLLRKGKHILFLATGLDKSHMVKEVFSDKKTKYPAASVTSDHNKVLWVLDKNAAKDLFIPS
jgi:6-phosphogluconolactonase